MFYFPSRAQDDVEETFGALVEDVMILVRCRARHQQVLKSSKRTPASVFH